MKLCDRKISVALIIGLVRFPAIVNAQQLPVQSVAPSMAPETAALLEKFKTLEVPYPQWEVGEKLVARHDKSVIPAMLELLKSPDRAQRCNAGQVLAGLGDDRGLFAVIAELKDTSARPTKMRSDIGNENGFAPDVAGQIRQDHYRAVSTLGRIGDKRAVPALIETLQDPEINYNTAYILAHLGDRRAVPALLAALKRAKNPKEGYSPNTDMRLWAGYGLMWLHHPSGLPAVVKCLNSPVQWTEIRHAAEALGEFGDKKAVPFLIKALKNEQVEVRVNVITALGRIGDEAAIPALKPFLKNTDAATGSARIQDVPVPRFERVTVREAAEHALQRINRKQ